MCIYSVRVSCCACAFMPCAPRTWSAHVPHMWNRCALYEINRGPIGGFFAAMRRESRFRDPMFDVSTQLQFEAWKVERAQTPSNATRAIQARAGHMRETDRQTLMRS